MKAAISIFVFIISAGAAILFLVNAQEQEYIASLEFEQQPEFFCGTHLVSPSLAENAKAGRNLFKANCAACHKLDAQSTGPALRGIHERYTTVDIIKFMRNDFSSKIKYTGERGYKCTSFPDLSDKDIESILLYTY
ncbi:c-type cytochrome [Kordia sp.]|uniref:c-type cytochrome n=1 Tax=Kordia sp. TaxID=1965332 RepID=UPI003B591CF7